MVCSYMRENKGVNHIAIDIIVSENGVLAVQDKMICSRGKFNING